MNNDFIQCLVNIHEFDIVYCFTVKAIAIARYLYEYLKKFDIFMCVLFSSYKLFFLFFIIFTFKLKRHDNEDASR